MNEADLARARGTLGNWRWRLSNLYYITDKKGRRVKFEMNSNQEDFFSNMHYMNVILKARQLGFTTLMQIFMLDACLFNSNIRAGTVAHNQNDAKAIFNDKVKYPYDNLPEQIKALRTPLRDSAMEIAFSNNSSLRVGTSLRSGTLQYLHISEYGKVCAKRPEQAREIRTGALNTVQAGQVVTVESTAEGRNGDFFRICEEAQTTMRLGAELSPLHWKFFFYPWHNDGDYWIDPALVTVSDDFKKYFKSLEEKYGVFLNAGQKAWYVMKAKSQQGDMKREFPSTPQEAFEAAIEGAYYGDAITKLEYQGRIAGVQAVKDFPVHTVWDLGKRDATSIWFWQQFYNEIRLVGYHEIAGEGLPFHAKALWDKYAEHGWSRKGSVDWVPHDARVTEFGSDKSRIEQMIAHKLNPRIVTELSLHDGINAVRAILPDCIFDQAECERGIDALKNYRKAWIEERGDWSDQPYHNWASHGADAFRYLACAHRSNGEKEGPQKPAAGAGTYGSMIQEQIRAAQRQMRR